MVDRDQYRISQSIDFACKGRIIKFPRDLEMFSALLTSKNTLSANISNNAVCAAQPYS